MKSRRNRTSFTRYQLEEMERVFSQTHYPNGNIRQVMSEKLDLAEAKIQVPYLVTPPSLMPSFDISESIATETVSAILLDFSVFFLRKVNRGGGICKTRLV